MTDQAQRPHQPFPSSRPLEDPEPDGILVRVAERVLPVALDVLPYGVMLCGLVLVGLVLVAKTLLVVAVLSVFAPIALLCLFTGRSPL